MPVSIRSSFSCGFPADIPEVGIYTNFLILLSAPYHISVIPAG